MGLNVRITDDVEALVCQMIEEDGLLTEPADPFGLDHDCLNPAGHQFTTSCGATVCIHCARIAWT